MNLQERVWRVGSWAFLMAGLFMDNTNIVLLGVAVSVLSLHAGDVL